MLRHRHHVLGFLGVECGEGLLCQPARWLGHSARIVRTSETRTYGGIRRGHIRLDARGTGADNGYR